MHDVMGIAPAMRAATPRVGATLVADDESLTDGRRDAAGGTAYVEDPPFVGHDLSDRGIASDPTRSLAVDDGAVTEFARLTRFPAQHLTRNGEGDLGSGTP